MNDTTSKRSARGMYQTRYSRTPKRHRILAPGEVSNAQLKAEIGRAFELLAQRKPIYQRKCFADFGAPSRVKDSAPPPPKTKADLADAAAKEYLAVPVRAHGSLKKICRKWGAVYSAVAMRVYRMRHEGPHQIAA